MKKVTYGERLQKELVEALRERVKETKDFVEKSEIDKHELMHKWAVAWFRERGLLQPVELEKLITEGIPSSGTEEETAEN